MALSVLTTTRRNPPRWLTHNVEQLAAAIWVSDDQDSLAIAGQQGVLALDTCDVMRILVAGGDLITASASTLVEAMAASGRDGVRMPSRVKDLHTRERGSGRGAGTVTGWPTDWR